MRQQISAEGYLETSGDLAPGIRDAKGRTFPLVRDRGFAEDHQKTGISCSENAFVVLQLGRVRTQDYAAQTRGCDDGRVPVKVFHYGSGGLILDSAGSSCIATAS